MNYLSAEKWMARKAVACVFAGVLVLSSCVTNESRGLQIQVDQAGLDAQPAATMIAPASRPVAESATHAKVVAIPESHARVPSDRVAAPSHVAQESAEPDHEAALSKTLDALRELKAGNKSFTNAGYYAPRREELTTGQHPIAAVLCCSDSRVPPELIFQQGLGDIFIVRVAGNVVSPEVLGSIEYAVEHLHVPLVVVMGHESCGAVKATVDGGEAPGGIGSLVKRIAPSVRKARGSGATGKALVEQAIDLNVDAMTAAVRRSPIVGEAIEAGHVQVLGAKYGLATGQVTWR